jgi:poly-gamma-glutamate synthesis protein (capsule biosynthesis protein)
LDAPSDTWWNSAIIQLEMDDHKVKRVLLHPVEMGRDSTAEANQTRRTGSGEHPFTEGRPMMAKGDDANRILDRYHRLSEPFGTRIEIRDGIGIIDLR